MGYRKKLDPGRSLRMTRSITGTRQKIIIMHNPNEIDHNQLLIVRFPNLDSDDVIIPGMANLSFSIKLSVMAHPKRVLVSNRDRVIINKLAVKFEGTEILGVDDFDVFACY